MERIRVGILGATGFGQERAGRESLVWALLAKAGFVRDYAAGSVMWLSPEWKGGLLDVGCGGGELMIRLRNFGWDVAGVELDPKARGMASEKLGLPVSPDLSALAERRFDIITLSHVIEHVPDPVATLIDCRKLLKGGGRIVLATPNVKSLGHRHFGSNWVHLDPPRHLFLFSPRNLRHCAQRAGLRIETLRTSARSAFYSWYASQLIKGRGAVSGLRIAAEAPLGMKFSGILFQAFEHQFLSRCWGEEIVLVGLSDN